MKPTKQTVYLPVKEANLEENYYLQDLNGEYYLEQKGYFFTPEQLNEYTTSVIKQALETAAEKAELKMFKKSQYPKNARWKKVSKKEAKEGVDIFSYQCQTRVDKQSIINTFDETFNKFKI